MKYLLSILGLCWLALTSIAQVNVTFRVDMSFQAVNPAGVHVAGSFQGWNPGGTPLANMGNGIWEVTLNINPNSYYEYKFVNGNTWGQDESVPGACNANGNRFVNVGGSDLTVPTVCFAACEPCFPPQHTVTFSVDMSNEVVNPAGVHIAGAFQGWDPAGSPMNDLGNGSWEISFLLDEGASYEYKFVNGNAWGQDESVPGACAVNNNRSWTVGNSDESVPTVCYASCDPCPAPPSFFDITFSVDMSNEVVDPAGIHLAGSFQGWDPAATPLANMGNGIWEVTLSLEEGSVHQYKFINGNTFGQAELVPFQCGISDGFGGYNREITVPAANYSIPTHCFNTCAPCVFVNYNITFQVDMSNEAVDPAGAHLAGSFNGWTPQPMNDAGNGLWTLTLGITSGQTIEYKFVNGSDLNNAAESVEAGCSNGSGNREFFVGDEEATLPVVCFGLCSICPENLTELTFQVDMTGFAVNPIGVFIVGSFQDPTPWTPGADIMSDAGGGVWNYTVSLAPGTVIQYKYLNGPNWANEETVPGGCGADNGFGGFNREWTVGNSDETIPLHCFSSCAACGTPPVNLTIQVDMSNQIVDPAGVHIAGSFQGWNPTGTPMTDLGGGIWSYELSLTPGDYIEYKFLNGNAWGQDELVPGGCNMNGNRFHTAAAVDETLDAVCFGSCTVCNPPQVNVTFQVDMTFQAVDPAGVHIAGSFQGWDPSATPMQDQGNGLWTITLLLDQGAFYEYKFVNGNAWGQDESVPAECSFFGNRSHTVGNGDETLPVVCFASCEACPSFFDVSFQVDMSQQNLDPSGAHLAGSFNNWTPQPMNDMGNGIWALTLSLVEGAFYEFKYVNGSDPINSEEVPLECASNLNRFVSVPSENLVLDVVCFGSCLSCKIDVTFRVDMFNTLVNPNGVHIAGSFQGWDPAATPMNYLGYGIWEVILELDRFTYYEYKFINGNSWGDDEDVPVECQTNWNRFFTTGSEGEMRPLVCFGECGPCQGCTDPFSLEFNPFAEGDNGSCATPVVWGCAYEGAVNYNPAANTDDGSCEFDCVSSCPADITGDGVINTADLLEMLSVFGTFCQ